MALERGTLLHQRYRIMDVLEQGGNRIVYRALDEQIGVDVAVKENLVNSDAYVRQFRLEAVILANLRHPNLPRVTDYFTVGDRGQYLVMDYIEGEDLFQRMKRIGTIGEDEAVSIGAAICEALTYLHTRKPPIVHRGITPRNVRITSQGQIFLVDFSLARVLHGDQPAGAARTDPRADIYSLGATLYASLSGRMPEDGLQRAMDKAPLTPLRRHNPKISNPLAAAIEKAMSVEPADRFQTADHFKKALLESRATPKKPFWKRI